MRYQHFKQQGLPVGSGHVESAIRRVINLRLKAPGTFWKEDRAEYFLFLRAQFISGRWLIFRRSSTSWAEVDSRRYYDGGHVWSISRRRSCQNSAYLVLEDLASLVLRERIPNRHLFRHLEPGDTLRIEKCAQVCDVGL